MKDNENIRLILGEGKKDEKAELLRKAENIDWEQEIRFIEVLAKLRKISYDAHIKAGFTPEQAKFLCRES